MNEELELPNLPDPKQLWKSRRFQKACDIVRWILLIFIVLISIYLIINIEYVRTMADPCAVCMEKTGATCMMLPPNTECFPIQIEKKRSGVYEVPEEIRS